MIGWVSDVRATARKTTNAVSRRAGRIRLLPAVILALGAGLAVAFIAYRVLQKFTPTSNAPAAPIDLTKVALTVVAGVGGVVALVIAYRRQRDVEQSRFVERFGAAAAQLGDTDVAVRIAGVYAMAGVADESDGLRRQQCIDVLCGYLRLPYTPELGANHLSKLVIKESRETGDGVSNSEQERHLDYRQNDRVVRETIVRVIADHLRVGAEYSWSFNSFDFRTAQLENADFSDAVFSGVARFDSAAFSGETLFSGATFDGTAWFDAATFSATTMFDKATFGDNALFTDATFSAAVWFEGATFSGRALFSSATFSGAALFEETTFSGTTTFESATFSGTTLFDKARFSELARLGRTTFLELARFDGAVFSSSASFDLATFSGRTQFVGVAFSESAEFRETTFSGHTVFDLATFSGFAHFARAAFASITTFDMVAFSGRTQFRDTTFSGTTTFERARFSGYTEFRSAAFVGSVDFRSTDFGSDRILFDDPLRWGPPAPLFAWNEDGVEKPENVEPQEWPPTVVTV